MAFKTMLRQLISKWGVMSIDLQTAFEADAVVEEDGDYLQTPAEELPEVVRSEPQESGAGETIGNPGDEQVKLNDL